MQTVQKDYNDICIPVFVVIIQNSLISYIFLLINDKQWIKSIVEKSLGMFSTINDSCWFVLQVKI